MENKKRIDGFTYGIQYYRAPTPLPEEWEHDLSRMADSPLDTIQLRVQWRWNEPAEGKYLFDDIDRLFALAEQYGKKVIFKFLMECAPDYIFLKYNGYRKDMNGNPMNPGALGAYYVGGWTPCFDNPFVVERAKEFVRVSVERYKKKRNLLLWNIWNEPMSQPIGECGCKYSTRSYRKWLADRYGEIDVLNGSFGKKWESFDTVNPPAMPRDYAEIFLWRLRAMDAVRSKLAFMYETVREIDNTRPVITHAAASNVLQDVAEGSSDDLSNAGLVDFYGTSLGTAIHFSNILEESHPFITCDWTRNLSEYFWVYELYPDWGNWNKPVSISDFRYKVWLSIASGCKGLLYWQYRAERLGNENNLAGLVNMDGSFKEVTEEAFRIGKVLKEYGKLLMETKVQTDDIGILYSLESDLINRIENTVSGVNFWSFESTGYPYLYKKALVGVYTLFRELGIVPQWVDTRQLKDRMNSLKLLYLPETFILMEDSAEEIKKFIENGGSVIAEEGVGLRSENTWLNTQCPGGRLGEIFGVKINERVAADKEQGGRLNLFGRSIPAGGYLSYLQPRGSEIHGCWENGRTGATRKGNAIFIGTSLGASFHDNYQALYEDYVHIMLSMLDSCGIHLAYNPSDRGLYIRKLTAGDKVILFAFNRSGEARKIALSKDIKIIREICTGGTDTTSEIPAYDVRVYLCNATRKEEKCITHAIE